MVINCFYALLFKCSNSLSERSLNNWFIHALFHYMHIILLYTWYVPNYTDGLYRFAAIYDLPITSYAVILDVIYHINK
jgi:hypothetical protein